MKQIKNRKARFEFDILEEFMAGIVLVGSEIKSIRESKAEIADAYCIMNNGELLIRNMKVEPYENAQTHHEVGRDRKLLLTIKELKRIDSILIDRSLTIIPLELNIDRLVKIKIGIAKGRKQFDKRNKLKEDDLRRETQRSFK